MGGAVEWLPYLATAVTPLAAVSGDALSYILGFGPLGIGIVLYQLGLIVPKTILARADTEAANWRAAYGDERKAHQATRDALVLASDRAEAAVETAKLTRMLLEEAKRDAGGHRALET
jgi:hypothetical protein